MQSFAIISGILGLLALPGLWQRVRQTTLVAPWCWAVVSGLAVLAVAIQGASDALLNYSAAVTTLLPAAAIYGAKRPQDRGWQWIVAALLLMLLWPAGESYFLERSFDLSAQPLRAWFLIVLLAVQGGNWIITTNAGSVLLLTAAQVTMLWPQLPWGRGRVDATSWLLGAALLALVPWWLFLNLRFRKHAAADPDSDCFPTPADLAEWKSFRAAYGVVWALRATERINEVAVRRHWPWRWSWTGAIPLESATASDESNSTASELNTAERTFWRQLWQNIFRRFLNPAAFPAEELPETNQTEANQPETKQQ